MPRLAGLLAVLAAVVVLLLIVSATTTDPEIAEDVSGIRQGGIEFGVDQCPLVDLVELGSAMPELGEPNESLATGGAQYVCNFGGTQTEGVSLQIIGGSTGRGGQPNWSDWAEATPGPETIKQYTINEIPMLVIDSTSDGERVAFPGPDRLVWIVDATLPDSDRARQVELTLARFLALE